MLRLIFWYIRITVIDRTSVSIQMVIIIWIYTRLPHDCDQPWLASLGWIGTPGEWVVCKLEVTELLENRIGSESRSLMPLHLPPPGQSSLTNTIGDQLVMIQQQSIELDELKANMHLVRQYMLQYQATQVNMAQNLQAIHSTVQEVANAMASMTLKLNQFCFPAALSLPACKPPTLQESLSNPAKQARVGHNHEAV